MSLPKHNEFTEEQGTLRETSDLKRDHETVRTQVHHSNASTRTNTPEHNYARACDKVYLQMPAHQDAHKFTWHALEHFDMQ